MLCSKIWIFVLIIFEVYRVQAITWFELKFETYSNPNSLEEDGDCCELLCSDPCDPKFDICFDVPGPGSCSLGRRKTGHFHGNTIIFAPLFENKTPNPIKVKIQGPWPETIFIKVTVDDDDKINADDRIGQIRKTFSRIPAFNESEAEWNHLIFNYPHSTVLNTVARVYCEKDYYGEDCNTHCVASDDDFKGHYTCSKNGSKICNAGYYGTECKTYCEPSDDGTSHYYCGKNGEHMCMDGWIGKYCTVDVNECAELTTNPCAPHGNCTNNKGSYTCTCSESYTGKDCKEPRLFCDDDPCSNTSIQCNNTIGGFQCICDEEWTGPLCDVPLTPCTSSPCVNNGVCIVDEDTYQCKCLGIWIGQNCEQENYEFMNDTKNIYLDGNLTENKMDDFNTGVRNLLRFIGIEDVAIETYVRYYPSINQTKVETFIESRDRRIVGAIARMLQQPDDVLLQNLILPMSKRQQLIKEPLSEKPTPWVKQHWYAVLLLVLGIIFIIAITTLVVFVIRQKNSRSAKMASENGKLHGSNRSSDPSLAIGFDNSVYYEINQPDKQKAMNDAH